jgi:hypothetical protein
MCSGPLTVGCGMTITVTPVTTPPRPLPSQPLHPVPALGALVEPPLAHHLSQAIEKSSLYPQNDHAGNGQVEIITALKRGSNLLSQQATFQAPSDIYLSERQCYSPPQQPVRSAPNNKSVTIESSLGVYVALRSLPTPHLQLMLFVASATAKTMRSVNLLQQTIVPAGNGSHRSFIGQLGIAADAMYGLAFSQNGCAARLRPCPQRGATLLPGRGGAGIRRNNPGSHETK